MDFDGTKIVTDFKRGQRNGLRLATEWLHERARTMNDPHAKQVLNSAAFDLGRTAKHGEIIDLQKPAE